MLPKGRILSIQSHVSFGYVGGKAAVFPLQCLGYEVDVVNTVNFSNHSGYGRFGGTRANAAELSGIFQAMDEIGLLEPSRLLTGYIPGAEALSAVADVARQVRKKNSSLIYLLDPVLGDQGKLYVAADVIPIYRSMLPLATIITPNWFEVEVLTEVEIRDFDSLRRALKILHTEHHVPHVVISSIPLSRLRSNRESLPRQILDEFDSDTETLLCVSSSQSQPNSTGYVSTVHARCIPEIPGYFSGVGDLFSALVLAHFSDAPSYPSSSPAHSPLSHAVTQALSVTHAILQLTHEHALTLPEDERLPTDEEKDVAEPIRKFKRMRGRELRLIQGQDIIRGKEHIQMREMILWDRFWQESE